MLRRLAARLPRLAPAGRRQGRRVRLLDDGDPGRRRTRSKVAHNRAGTRTTAWAARPAARTTRSRRRTGKLVEFRYTLATHVLVIDRDRPAARGHGRVARALAGRGHAGRAEDLRRRGRSDRTHLHARALARGDPGRRRRRGGRRRRADRARVRPGRPHRRAGGEVPAARRLRGRSDPSGSIAPRWRHCSPSSSGSRSASTASSRLHRRAAARRARRPLRRRRSPRRRSARP